MVLKQLDLFQGFTDEHLNKVQDVAHPVNFAAGDIVFQIGDASEEFFILKSGRVQVEIPLPEDENVISILSPVTIFGEVGLLEQKERSATVTAQEECDALKIENEDFLILLNDNPDMAARFYYALSRILYNRMTKTTEELAFYKLALSFQGH
jgi:CRP/FNR family cyclic AMP-dependent transcriptional regulator